MNSISKPRLKICRNSEFVTEGRLALVNSKSRRRGVCSVFDTCMLLIIRSSSWQATYLSRHRGRTAYKLCVDELAVI